MSPVGVMRAASRRQQQQWLKGCPLSNAMLYWSEHIFLDPWDQQTINMQTTVQKGPKKCTHFNTTLRCSYDNLSAIVAAVFCSQRTRHSLDSYDLRRLLRKHYTTLPRKNCNYMSFGSKYIDYQRMSTFFGHLYIPEMTANKFITAIKMYLFNESPVTILNSLILL
jgi:hypothetical protein